MGGAIERLPAHEEENSNAAGDDSDKSYDSESITDFQPSSELSEEEIPIKIVLDNVRNKFKCDTKRQIDSESSFASNNGSCSDSAHSSDEVSDEELPVVSHPRPRTSSPWRIVQELRDRGRLSRTPSEADSSDLEAYDASGESDNISSDSEYLPDTPPKAQKVFFKKEFKDLGITMRFTNKQDYNVMDRCKIEKWPLDKRNEEMEGILAESETLVSDILQIKGQESDFKDDILVSLNLAKNVSKRHKIKFKISSDGTWRDEDATFKGQFLQSNKAEFRVSKRFQHFVVVSELEVKKVKFSPEGATIKLDDKMTVDIPAGAVDADVDVNFKVIPPDSKAMSKYLEGDKPICKTITRVTECLYGNNPNVELKKPISIKLPFEKRPKNGTLQNEPIQDEEEDTTVVPFQMVGKNVKMMDYKKAVTVDDEGVCNIAMGELTGVFAASVKTKYLSDRQKVVQDVSLLFSSTYCVNIVTFRERKNMPTGFPRLWIQIVDKVDVEKVVERRKEENGLIEVFNSRSPDFNVFDGFRLRVDITGNLQGIRDIPKNHYFITYLDISDDNHKIFTVERSKRAGATGSIAYLRDKHGKGLLHVIDIDVAVGFDRAYRRDEK